MAAKPDQIIALERAHVLQTYRRPGFVLERGDGVYLFDFNGNRYLDLIGGIAVNALGYGDPEILEAIEQQAKKLIHVSNLYHTEPQARLAAMLTEHSFAQRVFFCNSGAESTEAALKFARKWATSNFRPDKHHFVAFTGSFHGRTFGALSTTWKEKYRAPFEPLVPGVRFATFNDPASAEEAIDDETCAVIVEPVQGEGGVNLARRDFLAGLRQMCDQHHALLIFDEVQCGLGRTGYLWAHEFYGVHPDIMRLAKPLGGGLPIGATLMTQHVAEAIQPGDHGSTFAANPVVCNVAQVVLTRVSAPSFLASVREKGQQLETELNSLREEFSSITEIRGRGLMWGIQVEMEAQEIVRRGQALGMLMGSTGEHVLRLLPPLTIDREHIAWTIEKLHQIFEEHDS